MTFWFSLIVLHDDVSQPSTIAETLSVDNVPKRCVLAQPRDQHTLCRDPLQTIRAG